MSECADQREDMTPEVYQLLVGCAPELLMLASADSHVRAKAVALLRSRAARYRLQVLSEVGR